MQNFTRVIYLIVAISISAITLSGCNGERATPKEFKYKSSVQDSLYQSDLESLTDLVDSLIVKKEGPFFPQRFQQTQKVSIDTILYSPELLQSFLIVVTENTNQSVHLNENPEGIHYNARAFLGNRDSLNSPWSIDWFIIINLNYYSSYGEISDKMKELYFYDLKTLKNRAGESRYKYNVNDIRFWDGPAWDDGNQMLEHHISGNGG